MKPPDRALPACECVNAETLAGDSRWWEIYAEAIRPEEREPPEVILKSLEQDVGLATRATADLRTIGLATLHLLRDPDAMFLVYIAVDPRQESRGLGSRIFAYTWQAGLKAMQRRGAAPGGMVWEVDIPALAATQAQIDRCERRIAYFARQGGQILPHPYRQPPVDGATPMPMHLMYRPVPGGALPDEGQSGSLVKAIYAQKYGAINGIPAVVLAGLLDAGPVAP